MEKDENISKMKKLFLFLLRRYSNTETQRIEIYKELWYNTKDQYNKQNSFGTVYNMNTEMLIANPFFESRVMLGEDEHLRMLKQGLANSFDESVGFILKK